MKYNFSKKIEKIKVKKLTDDEKNFIWSSVVFKKEGSKKLSFNFKKNMIGAILSLVLLLGGGGAVAAANNSVPGDTLFGLDLALEKARVSLANTEEKKNELKVRFAEERINEAENIIKKQSSVITRDIDLSSANLTEVEVDVFTNETTVKVEADDKYYGFITDKKDRSEIIDQIAEKYNLTESAIEAVLSFETEDRDSRADDKKFLNSFNSASFKSPKQQKDFEGSLSEVGDMVTNSNLSDEDKAKLGAALASIMVLLDENPNLDLEIKTKDGMKIEVEDGKIEIKTNNGKNDDKAKDDKSNKPDVKEDDDEVFCRGEWRDAEDCDDSESDSDDSDDDNDSDDSDDSDNSNDDSDDSDDDSDSNDDDSEDDDGNDDSEDDDNSGRGRGGDDNNDEN
ncbi:MAG: hypothetical protein QG646_505 [Euryarchaeota archaeon]|jgi:hypothetical protein|nr:hypothetical protein [Euryarchaeota archaeon]